MCKRAVQLFFVLSSLLYFTILLTQSGSASAGESASAFEQLSTPTSTPTVTPTDAPTDTSIGTPTITPTATPTGTIETGTETFNTVRLDNLQVRNNGHSSRYRITNLGNAATMVSQGFAQADGTNQFWLPLTELAAGADLTIDLATFCCLNLPSGWTGYVIITTNQPVAVTLLPVANFSPTTQKDDPPFTIRFVNTSFNYTSATWDFGDGQSSTDPNPTHTYAISGTYTVKLTVTAPGGSDSKVALIRVRSYRPIHPDGWDLSFGINGRVDSGCQVNSRLRLQTDGKIVITGVCPEGLTLLRYRHDGSLDATFDQDGRLPLTAPDNSLDIALQPDGKVLVAYARSLQRYHRDGSIDSTFGTNGSVTLFTEANELSSLQRMGLKSDGKIVLVGMKENQPVIVQLTSAGLLDPSFNQQGYVTLNLHDEPDGGGWQDLELAGDGKLVVGRTENVVVDPFDNRKEPHAVVARYTADGKLDASFGAGGIWNSKNIRIQNTVQIIAFRQLALQTAGKIIIDVELSIGPPGQAVLRLLPNGELDPHFAVKDGNMTFGDGFSIWQIDPSDHIWGNSGGPLTRLLPDGQVDKSFAKGGFLAPGNFYITDALIQPDGDILLNTSMGLVRYVSDVTPPPPPAKPLALLYAVLDNNLGDGWTRLVNNVEAGVRADVKVRLLVDGPTDNDVYLYDVQQDANPYCPTPLNPTCNGRYTEGVNFWRLPNENTAHAESLYQFLVDATTAHRDSSQITLALIGHGSGWSANVLPGQPSVWRGQNDTVGGMLWDDHPGTGQNESRSLSTQALGRALTVATQQTGKMIDLLYLDGCSMGMAEVAYEVRNAARYLLASPNIDWASFNYNTLLPEAVSLSGQALGKRWLEIEAAQFRTTPGYPFTLALLDLNQMNALAAAVSTVADTLRNALPTQKAQLLTAFNATDHFDSDYDGDLDTTDAYSDLHAFFTQLRQALPGESSLLQATQTLSNTLATTVLVKDSAGGAPWVFPNQRWDWRNYGGLGIYLPLGQDETRRQLFYHQSNLAWTADTTWDEFLAAFWANGATAAGNQAEMPVCRNTSQGCQGLANPLPVQTSLEYKSYLPMVKR